MQSPTAKKQIPSINENKPAFLTKCERFGNFNNK